MSETLVVDLCGTLVLENTTHGFLKYLPANLGGDWYRLMLLSRSGQAIGHFFPRVEHRRRLIGCLTGFKREWLEQQAGAYASVTLATKARTRVVRQVLAAPEQAILASASIDVVVAAFASLLGVSTWVATELDYDDAGRCTGRIKNEATGCKLRRLEAKTGRSFSGFQLITDNPEDTDLMSIAGHVDFIDPHHD